MGVQVVVVMHAVFGIVVLLKISKLTRPSTEASTYLYLLHRH